MIHIEYYSPCLFFWRNPYYILEGKKHTIYYTSAMRPYWSFGDKLYFVEYYSVIDWEYKLFISDIDISNIKIRNAESLLHSSPHHLIFHRRKSPAKHEYFFPQDARPVYLSTKDEGNWRSRIRYYYKDNELIGKVVVLQMSNVFKGRVAQIEILPGQESWAPYLFGTTIIAGL